MSFSPEVEAIQKDLNEVNIPVAIDGIFGEETEQGIILFQKSYTPTNNIHKNYQVGKIDGVVGKKTLLALDEAIVEGWKYFDVDDVYITFIDKRISVPDFAKEVYLSTDRKIMDHILHINPHLKRTFSQIMPGMSMVIAPFSYTHPDLAHAQEQVEDMMSAYFELSDQEREWFAQHHGTATNAIITAATSELDVHQGQNDSSDFQPLNLTSILAGSGAVIAGGQVQGNRLSKTMKSFAGYSEHIAAQTKGLSGQALYSSEPYKEWRKTARQFQQQIKSITSEIGNPSYIKEIQPKKVNNYLNVGKKQLYRAKDFSKAISGIEMTALYKRAMSFSKMLGRANGIVIAAGLYGNVKETVDTCNSKGWFEEQCGRSATKNTVSGGTNVIGGVLIGISLALIPVTGGLSIALLAGGTFAWGIWGGDLSNDFGEAVEEWIYD